MASNAFGSPEDPFVALAARELPLTILEATEVLQVSPKVMRGLIRDGALAATRSGKRKAYEIEPATLLKYLKSRCSPQFFVVK